MAKEAESKSKRERVLSGDQWLLVYMMTLIFFLGAIGLYVIASTEISLSVSIVPLVTLIAQLLGNLAAKPSFPVVLIPSGSGTPGEAGATGEQGETGETGAQGEPGASGKGAKKEAAPQPLTLPEKAIIAVTEAQHELGAKPTPPTT